MARFCTECGTELPEGAHFCPACGSEVSGGEGRGTTRGAEAPRRGRTPSGGKKGPRGRDESWLGPYTTPVLVILAATVLILLFIGLQNRGGPQPSSLPPGQGVPGTQQSAEMQQQIQEAQRRLLQDPEDQAAIEHLAHLYFETEEWERAETYYRRALEEKPESPELRTDLGTVLNRMDRKQEAIDQFEKVLEYAPDFITAKFNIGVVNAQTGDTGEALRWFREVAQEVPGSVLGRRAAEQVEALGGRD